MDDTQQDSDSDWDSTLDFTSPRHLTQGPRINLASEIEDEEFVFGEAGGDQNEAQDHYVELEIPDKTGEVANGYQDISQREEPSQRSQVKQQAQKKTPVKTELFTANGPKKRRGVSPTPKPGKSEVEPPPYNFRDAVTGKMTPEPTTQKPGKDRKGTTYDKAPTPTPRGATPTPRGAKGDSFRSVGSWDDSDQDEKTLQELRINFSKEKQREQANAEKQKLQEEPKSEVDNTIATNRSEVTWKSRRPKSSQQQAMVQVETPIYARPHQQVRQARPVQQEAVMGTTARPQQVEIMMAGGERFVPQYKLPAPEVIEPAMEEFEEPRHLYTKDEDHGRYLYYFGHGNLRFFEVNEDFEEAVLPKTADKLEKISQRVWQEFFAVIRIITSFFIFFIVEFFKFMTHHILQPLIVGVFITLGDFLIKPLLSAIFNGFMQPTSIFFWNVFMGLRHMFKPVGEILHRIIEQLAMLFRSIRLFEIHWKPQYGGYGQLQQV